MVLESAAQFPDIVLPSLIVGLCRSACVLHKLLRSQCRHAIGAEKPGNGAGNQSERTSYQSLNPRYREAANIRSHPPTPV